MTDPHPQEWRRIRRQIVEGSRRGRLERERDAFKDDMLAEMGLNPYARSRYHARLTGLTTGGAETVDYLKGLYVKGRISVEEFEERVARAVASESHDA